jgi:hypothetical protein
MARQKMAPEGMTEKLTITMSKEEAAELEAECERLTALDADGFGRRVTKSDVVRRWWKAGKIALAEAEKRGKR